MEELKSTEGLSTLLSARGPRLATAVLAVLIALQAGFMVTSQNRRIAPATPSASPQAAHQAPQLQVSSIVAAHLFGEAHSTDNDADAPQTSVQLVLAGVLAVPDPKRGLALIGPNAGTAKLYAVGSAVPGGVSLHAVYPDRVLLDRGGVIESLILPKKFTALTTQTAIASGGQSPAQRLAALAQNGGLLGGLVRASAVFAQGSTKLSGYRIFPGGRGSIASFTQLGLRPGDLITAVNGTTLDDPSRANEILQTLSNSGSANITIQRNGQSMDLNLNLETVVNDAESAAAQGAAVPRRGGTFGGTGPAEGNTMAAEDQTEGAPNAQ